MSGRMSVELPASAVADDVAARTGDDWQVILYNDDVNEAGRVVRILARVFGHPHALAFKIMMEAHRTGRAIAQVEEESAAHLHAGQLRANRLQAVVERIG